LNVSDLDLAAVSQALDDYDPDREHYLDLNEGSIWTFVFSESTDETRRKVDRIRADSGGAHVRIPSITTFRQKILTYPQERQQWMVYRKERSRSRLEAFLDTLQGNRAETGSTG
jgi:hypothetical protein